MHRTDSLIRDGALLAPRETGNSEICNLYSTVRQNHNILRFNIAVHYTFIVSVLKAFQYLNGKMHSVFPAQASLTLDILF